ncbi:MAG TPA: hypothetical protein PLF32_10210 [Bacteroidales bacterium]|nr:hypothetical protein [Bacteroidales bacterium]
MQIAENKELGLLAVSPDDSNENISRFARMKYSGDLGCYTPDCSIQFGDFVSFRTKKEAVRMALKLRYTANHVCRIGNRWGYAWGIRHDFRDNYFLAIYD